MSSRARAESHFPIRVPFSLPRVRIASLSELFGVDLRSLALFRMGIAAVILRDLLIRLPDLRAFYSDAGVMPRTVLLENSSLRGMLSLHLMNGTVAFQALLFFVAFVFGILLLVGYRTKLSAIVSWVLLVSLQNRNALVLQGGDMLLRCLLFWALFLPMGARLSVDALTRRHEEPVGKVPKLFLSAASAALLLQVAVMYWQTVLLKTAPEWIPDGTAVYYTLHIDQFVKPLGVWLRQFPDAMKALTFATWYWELIGPFLLFMPIFFLPLRLFAVLAFMLLHLGLNATLELDLFPLVNWAAMLAFLPSEVWDGWRAPRFFEKVKTSLAPLVAKLPPAKPIRLDRRSVIAQVAVGLLFVYAVLLNVEGIERFHFMLPDDAEIPSEILRIDQLWNMFAPYPLRDDGWYVMPGKLEDGTDVDVYHLSETKVSWEKPEHLAQTFTNDRWRSYLMLLWQDEGSPYLDSFARYYCGLWNEARPEGKRLKTFTVNYMLVTNGPPDKPVQAPEKLELWVHDCLGDDLSALMVDPPTGEQAE